MSRTARELGWLALALVALAGAFAALEAARAKGDTRRALARVIRREASTRDVAIVVDEAPELVALMRPVPSLWGVPPLSDLAGVRRVYALAPGAAALLPFFARLGPAEPFHGDARVRRWEVAGGHLGRPVFDALEAVGTHVTAAREGGVDGGECPFDGGRLACKGAPWNHVVAEPHRFDGVEQRCVFAHPQADGRLVISLARIPAARAVVGVMGIDDAGYHPNGAPVNVRVEYRAEGSPPVVRELVTPNRRGVVPWRIDVAHRPATATLTITTADAGARQFCFTLTATE